ncbi:unnamed protein product [Brassica oleracea var. botrytis]|uniref:RNase H type-1 domain-containing protein n=2 Tax=Brassica TaxID=3705 RepID=A0A3P6F9L2_BRAOL|nr:unnamed protein product [Brassica napus]CDY09526.1 BnaC05g23930D [Brassica napus]VDD44191.1 unnamed protein product [Brassica oleracea]
MLAGRVINLSCVVTKVGFSSAPCHQVDRERLSLACLDNRVKIAAFLIQIKTIYSRKRHVFVQGLCSLCQVEAETINHMLFRCTKAQELWNLSLCPKPVQGFSMVLEENVTFLFHVLDNRGNETASVRSLPWLMWNVWTNSNVILYAATQESPLLWVHNAEEEATLWLEVNKQAQCLTRQSSTLEVCERWSPPLSAWITRDHTGNVLFHERDAFTPSANRLIAELRGTIWVLRSARDLHFTSVSIASDHLEIIEAISAPSLWPRFRALLEQINSLGAFFVRYRLKSRKYTLI